VKLTPLDIRKQEFKKALRGVDAEEVEAFLSMVADEFELLIREKNHLNDELIKLRTQLKDYQQVEHTLRETLVKAQSTVDESRANSRREAEIVIQEAELKAEQIIREAREDLQHLKQEVRLVKTQKESFAKRLRHLLESQIELLEVMEIEDTDGSDSPAHTKFTHLRGRLPRGANKGRVEEEEGEPGFTEQHGAPRTNLQEKSFPPHKSVDLSQDMRESESEPPTQKESDTTEDRRSRDRLSDQIII
jgi:cell division initiation protein